MRTPEKFELTPVRMADNGKLRIDEICTALDAEYGSPRLGNKDDPLDELVFIILSNRTQAATAERAFQELRTEFPSWESIDERVFERLADLLRPAGMARLKAGQIVSIIGILKHSFGSATLDPLRSMPDEEVEAFLCSLPGVAKKVAKCVAMYSLDRDVLPVDVHVHRLAGRLGFRVKKRPDTSQDLIEAATPPHLRYGFHVNAVAHGRSVCLPRTPRCEACCIAAWCEYRRQQGGTSE